MMTDQQAPVVSELGQKFGAQLAQAYAEIITLEKQIRSQAITIQGMRRNEERLLAHIEELKFSITESK